MAGIKIVDTTGAKMADLGNGAFLGENMLGSEPVRMREASDHLLVGDIDASADNQLSSGFYIQHKSEKPLSYTYTYDEMKIVIEGELHIKEPSTGTSLVAKVGDVLNISNGAALEFNSTDKARIFYVAKRAKLE
ncbi:hypothetical protein CBS101457_004956 [Exobasidium rhododendri]|nr:hypothetical protein CBS101457_004956 [Exobasidium rhododendri]